MFSIQLPCRFSSTRSNDRDTASAALHIFLDFHKLSTAKYPKQ